MAEFVSAKLISFLKIDFSSESEMNSFIDIIEKIGENFYNQLKEVGLIRWRINRVWNKKNVFEISLLFEYKDENAYTKGQKVINKFMSDNKSLVEKINLNRTPSRAINIFDFYD